MLPVRFAGNRFEWCEFRLLWSVTAGLCSIVAIGYSSYRIVTLISYPLMDIVRHLIYCEFVIRFGVILMGYISTWFNHKNLIVLGNTVWFILDELKPFNIPTWIDRKLAVYGFFKIVFVDIFMCMLFAVNFHFNIEHDPVPLLERAMNVYVVFMMAQVSNACLLSLYMAAHLYRSINWQLRITIGELCALEYVKNETLKQQVFENALRNLTVLDKLHCRVTEFILGICRVYGVPLALINLNQFLVIISRTYFVYVSAILELKNEFSINIHRYINSILYLLFEIVHIIYLVSAAELAKKRGEKTIIHLNEFFETDVADSVTRKIESFSAVLSTNKPNVSLFGLYALDFTLLFSMATVIALKLIVLIQIQLKE
ncbi:uncharacterized protein LOC134221297 isoform X2 [Armigeres subalbatus]|uniref:uncharacterized protein LOC134221297 isoform X2 n=1 Tax=Armigeres subalbatus TaxID=124917 RepID=UPI002ED50B1D